MQFMAYLTDVGTIGGKWERIIDFCKFDMLNLFLFT